MIVKNLTPHEISIQTEDSTIRIAPEPVSARVSMTRVRYGYLPAGVPLYRVTYGDVTGLPDPAPDTIYVVSLMVASARPREDVFSPGELVRDADGKPVACLGLTASY